jgi:hypothetical protein
MSALPDQSVPLAMRTRSRMPNVTTGEDLPVTGRRRRTAPASTAGVPFTKKGPPIGQRKSAPQTVPAAGGSVSDQRGDDRPVEYVLSCFCCSANGI